MCNFTDSENVNLIWRASLRREHEGILAYVAVKKLFRFQKCSNIISLNLGHEYYCCIIRHELLVKQIYFTSRHN